jgi:hypothetical protein
MRTEIGEVSWDEIHVGAQSIFAAAGMQEVSRPGKRRLVMRIEFDAGRVPHADQPTIAARGGTHPDG